MTAVIAAGSGLAVGRSPEDSALDPPALLDGLHEALGFVPDPAKSPVGRAARS